MKYMFVFNVPQPSHNGPSIAEKKKKKQPTGVDRYPCNAKGNQKMPRRIA
jgi:hypothetical protein